MDEEEARVFLQEIGRHMQDYLGQVQPQLDAGVASLRNLARVTRHQPVAAQADQLEQAIQNVPMGASIASANVAYGQGDGSMVQASTRKAIQNALVTAQHYEKFGLGHNDVAAAAKLATPHLQQVAQLLSDDAMNQNVLDPAAERVRP
jgi:hypothetical protein